MKTQEKVAVPVKERGGTDPSLTAPRKNRLCPHLALAF